MIAPRFALETLTRLPVFLAHLERSFALASRTAADSRNFGSKICENGSFFRAGAVGHRILVSTGLCRASPLPRRTNQWSEQMVGEGAPLEWVLCPLSHGPQDYTLPR